MNDDEFDLNEYGIMLERVAQHASDEVERMGLPKAIVFTTESFLGLGEKFNATAIFKFQSLTDTHGPSLPYLAGISLRETWFAIWCGAHYFREGIKTGSIPDNDMARLLSTPEGYGRAEGWAVTLNDKVSELTRSAQRSSFLIGTPYAEVEIGDILDCMCLYFFSLASDALKRGAVEMALDWIYEATEALRMSNGIFMWGEGQQCNKKAQSEAAQNVRHAETRALKKYVFDWCDENLSKYPSMNAAAEVAKKLVPVRLTTVRGWISEWKKEQSPNRP